MSLEVIASLFMTGVWKRACDLFDGLTKVMPNISSSSMDSTGLNVFSLALIV